MKTLVETTDSGRRSYALVQRGQGYYTLKALVDLFGRRIGIMGTIFTLVLLAAAAVAFLQPREYESEIRILVKRERPETSLTPGSVAIVASAANESEIASEIELLRSRELIDAVLVSLRMAPDPTAGGENSRLMLADAARKAAGNLKVVRVGSTNLISARFAADRPETAALFLNTLANAYLNRHIALRGNKDASAFFNGQTDEFQKELNEAQQGLSEFRQKNDVMLLNEQKQATLRRSVDLEASVQEAASQARDAEERIAVLRRQLASLPSTIETSSRTSRSTGLIERLKGQLLELENKRVELLTKYDPSYRLVRELDQQIAQTKSALQREQSPQVVDQTNAPNPLRQSIEAQLFSAETGLGGLRARRASLQAEWNEFRRRQSRLESVTGEHDDLQRRAKLAEDNLLLYEKKREESRLAEALDQRKLLGVSVVEKAEAAVEPASRHRSVILLIGFLIAACTALGAAFVVEYFAFQEPVIEIPASVPVRLAELRPITLDSERNVWASRQ